MNAGIAKRRKEMAVLATMTNATRNATPGSPPASAVVAAAGAAAAAAANDNNNNKDDYGVNLDALRRRIHNLRRMLNASADRLADAVANAAVARVKCARTLELAKQRAGEGICQVKEELRRTRIEAERFRVGWTRLRTTFGGRGRKRRAEGASALLSAAWAAEAKDAPPHRLLGGGSGVRFSPFRPPLTPPLIVVVAEDPRQD